MPDPTIPELEARINHLERDNRWLRWILALAGIAWIVGVVFIVQFKKPKSGFEAAQVIEVQRLVIKDPAGKVRVIVGRDESAETSEPYGIFIHGKDGDSEARLTDSNLHIHYDKGSANFSPISVDISQHKLKVSKFFSEISRVSDKGRKQNFTKQEEADLIRLTTEFEPTAKFYLNMVGPYLELSKKTDGQAYSGAGRVQVGVSPYPSVTLNSSEDKTSFSLSALKDGAGLTMRDGQGNKRVSLDVDSSAGVGMNLYDKDGKTLRGTFGNVTLQTIRTGGVQQRPVSSLVLFDKDGKSYWSTP